jgi:hypothetical protein
MTTIRTTHNDFRPDDRTVTIPSHIFAALADQLAQYQRYADEMRAIGRGFSPSSPLTEEYTVTVVNAVLGGAK